MKLIQATNKLSLDHTNDVYWIILGGIFAVRDDIKSKLDAVFAKHDESKRKAAEAQHKESSFLRAFLDAREKTIRPAMVEVGEYVRGMGYAFRISTEEDGLSMAGTNRLIPASIKIEFPIGEPPTYNIPVPSFEVICEKHTQRVLFHENTTGGQSSSAGDASLSELTRDMIQERILAVVAEVFR